LGAWSEIFISSGYFFGESGAAFLKVPHSEKNYFLGSQEVDFSQEVVIA
jgi:hypothetical protein